MDEALRARFAGVSVASICTALFKRGLKGQLLRGVGPLGVPARLVGPAYTLRTIPAREDLNTAAVHRDPAHPQRAAIEACPPGAVLVVDSRQDASAASAGDILITRLMVRGCAGMVTDGGFRDSAEIAEIAFPAYHAQPSPQISLATHQAVEANVPIACGGAPVWPGDIMVGDEEGVVVVPAHLATDIAEETHEMTVFEDFAAEQVRAGRSIIGLYPPTDPAVLAAFKAWRTSAGR